MSIRLMASVWQCDFDHGQQAVMLAMADHADDNGDNCYPSIPLIAWKTGYSERQVSRVMHGLTALGVLVVVKAATNKRPAEYAIRLEKAAQKPKYGAARGDTMSGLEATPCHPKDNLGVTFAPLGVTFETSRGDTMSPKPPIEPSLKATKEKLEEGNWKILLDKLAMAGVFIDSPLMGDMYGDLLGEVGLRPILDSITDAVQLGNGRVRSFKWIAKVARGKFHGDGPSSNGNGAGGVDTSFAPLAFQIREPREKTIEDEMWKKLEGMTAVEKLARNFGRFEGDTFIARCGWDRAKQLVSEFHRLGIQVVEQVQ